ncbi:hypothetical protein MON38_11625 [Hymenobacter sp. DH14]|uniref:Uncharacterized protein n=1 Tax=Hymenobacter cyanobacteriorum TaxID=2926463 RepID=A0A9X1VFR2_9BACT|nr:hypothetical protein [Hymenobacter cyanobacteriorum]MCI1188071.1 hypothetical protein [Hymenobacter cyanobacteriorum]
MTWIDLHVFGMSCTSSYICFESKQFKAMPTPIDVSSLPASDREDIARLFQSKLQLAIQQEKELQRQLAPIRESVTTYKSFLEQLGLPEAALAVVSNITSIEHQGEKALETVAVANSAQVTREYSSAWTHAEKIMYVLKNPEEYGFRTFVGASSVVDAIIQEEKNLDRILSKDNLKNIGPTLSRMIGRDQAFKFLEKGSLSRYHFVSSDWFGQDGRLKAEFAIATRHLQIPANRKPLTLRIAESNEKIVGKTEQDVEDTLEDNAKRNKAPLELFSPGVS